MRYATSLRGGLIKRQIESQIFHDVTHAGRAQVLRRISTRIRRVNGDSAYAYLTIVTFISSESS